MKAGTPPGDYVVGFIFTSDRKRVLLIHKKRPHWQAGYLNGVGGRVRADEPPIEAMSREAEEECGIVVDPHDWRCVAHMKFPNGRIWFFDVCLSMITHAVSRTDEPVCVIYTSELIEYDTIPNLQYLIPLCCHAESRLSGSSLILPLMLDKC